MIDRHLAKLRVRDALTAEEAVAMRDAVTDFRDVAADQVVVRSQEVQDHSTLLIDGLMCRYKDLQNGQRQITQLNVAGDFVDLHSFTLKYLDHDVMTLTPCRIGIVPHDGLRRISEQFPHLARLLWFTTNLDAAIHREWVLSLGRRSARAKLAALFSELQLRLEVVGLADGRGYDLPLTQTDVAECTGLTNVHVNRILRELREEGIVDFHGGRVTILDRDRLWRTADFDPAYLYLDKRPR
jgi:CRP-like cAMP-binding protein